MRGAANTGGAANGGDGANAGDAANAHGSATMPVLIRPTEDRSLTALLARFEAERAGMLAALQATGALLFRGWDTANAESIEAVARAINPDLKNEYLGTSPRNALTKYVFTASELPPFYPIPQHCEMSFTKAPPTHLFFGCLVPNRAPGGETPLVDVRKVWKELAPDVRERFEKKGVTNIRNYAGLGGSAWWDPWKLKRWDEMFGTTDRDAVTSKCESEGFTATWDASGRLRLVNTQPAFRAHPASGELAWFNHSQVFHREAVPPEYGRIAARMGPKWRFWQGLAWVLLRLKGVFEKPENAAMHCTFGDGSEISAGDMEAVREAIWRNLVAIPWERGDIVAIDNRVVAHGRLPYSGERLVAVAWA